MAVTKHSMPSRNDALISGPDVMLDGGLQPARSRGNKVRLWHLADIYAVAEHVRLWG
jgi:hypothetical protein